MKWVWLLAAVVVVGGGVSFAESTTSGDSSPQPQPAPGDDGGSSSDSLDIFSGGGGNVITNDPSTWPTGGPIEDIARAIAFAEGANIAGSVPDRLNNPGDISDGAQTFGAQSHDGSSVTTFPDKETGWKWLIAKLNNIASGNSSVYSPTMSWTQIAQKWAGNWSAWVNNVTQALGVSPDSAFGDYANQ